jgi:hypothetical protein
MIVLNEYSILGVEDCPRCKSEYSLVHWTHDWKIAPCNLQWKLCLGCEKCWEAKVSTEIWKEIELHFDPQEDDRIALLTILTDPYT